MKMWDKGRVEYNGGDSFTIIGKFHVGDDVFDSRVEVQVQPESNPVLVDDEYLAKILNGANYRQSLSVRTGKSLEELEAMAKAGTLFEFAKANRPVGTSRTFIPGTSDSLDGAPGTWRLEANSLGVLSGRIRLARQDEHPNVVYHEFFHSVMGFMRTIGAFTEDDVKVLVRKYGANNRLGKVWFNEEAAAEDFRRFVETKGESHKNSKGRFVAILQYIEDVVNELERVLFSTGRVINPDQYGNDMEENPLVGIVLTGRVPESSGGSLFVNHSGGADGADSYWGDIGEKYGVPSNHYYYKNRTPKGNVPITDAQFKEGWNHVLIALKSLGRAETKKPHLQYLLARTWWQVKNSDAVFAVAPRIYGKNTVEKGTGYAVQMAIDSGKPVYLFNLASNHWEKYDTGSRGWVECSTPTLTRHFAGVGARDLTPAGQRAIEDVYRLTFANADNASKAKPMTFEDKLNYAKENAMLAIGMNPKQVTPAFAMIVSTDGLAYDEAVESLFTSFLGRLSSILQTADAPTREAAISSIVEEFDNIEPITQYGTKFMAAYDAFMREYGPEAVEQAPSAVQSTLRRAADDIVTSDQKPNPVYDSDIQELINIDSFNSAVDLIDGSELDFGTVVDADDTVDMETQFSMGDGLASELKEDLAPVTASLREELRRNDRMARPYTRAYTLARAVGLAIRAGLDEANIPVDALSALNRCQQTATAALAKDVALAAIRKTAALYGVDLTDTGKAEKLLFRAIGEVSSMVGPWTADFGHIMHASHHKGYSSPSSTHVSAATLAAAFTTSVGVRPHEIIGTAIEDIDAIMTSTLPDGSPRYGTDSSFYRDVYKPVRSALVSVATADANQLMGDGEYREDVIGEAIRSIEASLTGGERNSDGTLRDFIVSKTPDASENPYFDTNQARYMDHESNPDFQNMIHRSLDALYVLAASVKFYRDIGTEPGDPRDAVMIRNLAPDAPAPMTAGQQLASLNAAPEQLLQKDFDTIDFYDQSWVCANHPDAWLDSVTRPHFGGNSFAESALEAKRKVSGFHTRESHLNAVDARRWGLDVLPGQAYTRKLEDRPSEFVMDGGEIVRSKGETVENYDGYRGGKAVDETGAEIISTLNDQRNVHLLLNAWRVRFQGGTRVLTGVDSIVFGPEDSFDPEYYTWDKVQQRERQGTAHKYSAFDRALVRLHRQLMGDESGARNETWENIVGPEGLDYYTRLVNSVCKALRSAHDDMNTMDPDTGLPVISANEVNDYVLREVERDGLISTREMFSSGLKRNVRTEGIVSIPVSEIEDLFFTRRPETYRKLVAAKRFTREIAEAERTGRNVKDIIYENYVRPHRKVWNELREFVDAHPFLSAGDGRFFHNVSTPLPFVQGSGFFMYYANRADYGSDLKATSETMNRWEEAFRKLVGDQAAMESPIYTADPEYLQLFAVLFHTREKDTESIRAMLRDGSYVGLGPKLTADATVRDLALVIYERLTGMVWSKAGDPVYHSIISAIGGKGSVGRMLRFYENERAKDQTIVSGGVGMTDELVYRMTGTLPANHQLGHAVQNAIDGITNAYTFRSTLYDMLTTPDEDGLPVCYAKPAIDAADTGGIPDNVWGTIARWWSEIHNIEYDVTRNGVWNANHIYGEIFKTMKKSKTIEGKAFGEIKGTDIDQPSITGFIARTGTPEEESKLGALAGGYALGYAKHLFQSTRGFGRTWQRAMIHRALGYSKSLSVTFSYFFPLATRFESPIGAVGALATLGGNFSPEAVREHAETFRKLQSVFRGKGWITKDFLGQRDVFDMLDSDDPFLSELYHWASAIGLSLSDATLNPMEHSRGIMQEDLKKATNFIRRTMGSTVAARVGEIMNTVLTKGGERAFTYHLNATKLAVAAQLCQRFQVEAARRGVAFDPVRDLKRYSGYINAEVGGIDPLKYAWAHPAARNWMTTLLFSWEWTRGAWEAGGIGPILEQVLFGGHDITQVDRKFMLGRATRMFLEVMIGLPILGQLLCKLLGETLIIGLGDDDELTEEQKRLVKMVRDTPWFTWHNEDKTFLTAYDITPLMAGISARFPKMSEFLGEHPFLHALPAVIAGIAHKPWLLVGTLPIYTGRDKANQATRGRRYYQHFGKQGWEVLRWFEAPRNQFFSKLSMPLQRIIEGVCGRSLTAIDRPLPWDNEHDIGRWLNPSMDSATFNLVRAFIPFSVASLIDSSDAGFLPMVGPVQLGASSYDVKQRLTKYLDAWSGNDRKGYAFGGPVLKKGQNYGKVMMKRSPEVAALVREAMYNGMSEKDAFALVGQATNGLTGKLYGQILEDLNVSGPDVDIDEKSLLRHLRKAQRLGKLSDKIYDALKSRLEKQRRWGELSVESRQKIQDMLRYARSNPYGERSKGVEENRQIRYTY